MMEAGGTSETLVNFGAATQKAVNFIPTIVRT
jgi:hypothetical protein